MSRLWYTCIYNIIEHVCVCLYVCLSNRLKKINASTSVEPGKAREWLVVANLRQMKFRQMKFRQIKFRQIKKSTFLKKWQNHQFLQISQTYKYFKLLCSYILWPLWSQMFVLFSICNSFPDKNLNLPKFWIIIKYSKYPYVALTYNDHCAPKFSSTSLFVLPFSR